MTRILNLLGGGETWAIEPSALESIISIARRENDLQAVLKHRGEPLENTHNIEVRDGVAIIPVNGPLFPRANLFGQISGAYSVEMLALDLSAAEANEDVRAVVLSVDSPGGKTTMINEFSAQVRGFKKPIVAYVVGSASSAAYWIASAADKVVLDDTAMVGSIGVVAGFQAEDSDTIEIVSSNAADKRPDLKTESGRAVVQAVVDEMETVFIDAVATNRGLSHEKITALRGGVVIGARAVEKGFADEVGSLESVITSLQLENPMDLNTLKADHNDVYQAVFDQGVASVDAEQACLDGAKTERERISAIMNHQEAQGREAQAKAFALETDMTAEAAAKVLVVSPKAEQQHAGDQFSQYMNSLGNPAVGAGNGDDSMPDDGAAGWTKAYQGLSLVRGKG